MKKFLSIIAMVILTMCMLTLTGCGNTSSINTPSETTDTSGASNTDDNLTDSDNLETELPVLDPTDNNSLDVYRQEIKRRLSLEDPFGDDWGILETYDGSSIISTSSSGEVYWINNYNRIYKEVSRDYFPVIFQWKGEPVVWSTTEYGEVFLDEVDGHRRVFSSSYLGSLHHEAPSDEVIDKNVLFSISYSRETGTITRWEFGEITGQYMVPEGAVYCGNSFWGGHIFRSDGDVYALVHNDTDGYKVNKVASGVSQVITTDYSYNSDYSGPLFMMKDGTLKVYRSGELLEMGYEGGYHPCATPIQ